MDLDEITQIIRTTFDRVDVVVASKEGGAPEISWGDRFFYYGTERTDPFPFATLVTKDYTEFDCASHLNRPGVFRLNIGISRATFLSLFSTEAGKGSIHDFTALDMLMPHPVYGSMFWVCILNPSAATFQNSVLPLLTEAYARAVRKHEQRGDQP